MLWSRFVIGYHGCDAKLAERLVCKKADLSASQNDYDWLGHGIYFWKGSPERAKQWAIDASSRSDSKVNNPAVLGAVIDLGNCLNLVESEYLDIVQKAYHGLKTLHEKIDVPMPENTGRDMGSRRLDCAVFEYMHYARKQEEEKQSKGQKLEDFTEFDSVRAFFVEGPPLYPNAGIRCMDHVQICVRNPAKIIGLFLP